MRQRVGLFDVSHMGTFVVSGSGAKDGLNEVFTNDLNRISAGQAQYSLLCNERGGVIDDVFVYLAADDQIIVVPNAANASIVIGTVERVFESSDVRVEDRSKSTAIIAVQGRPVSRSLKPSDFPATWTTCGLLSWILTTDTYLSPEPDTPGAWLRTPCRCCRCAVLVGTVASACRSPRRATMWARRPRHLKNRDGLCTPRP